MEYGHVSGVEKPISRIVQGTIQISDKDDEGFPLMDAAFELGINAFDTAYIYGGKDAFLGRWMKARDLREKVVVLAKGCHHSDLRRRVTPYDIGTELHDTLARMKTDYIDLYVLHRDDPDYPVEPIVDALNGYVKEGKIRAFGGSNWTTTRLKAANDYAAGSGQLGFAASSPNFSLAEQVEEPWEDCVTISGPQNNASRAWYAENKMPLFTWSSMAGGFWSGKFERDNIEHFRENGDYFEKLVIKSYAYPQNFERLDRVKELATKRGLTVPQIALAWVLSYPLEIFALVGSATPAEMKANVAASEVKLTPEEVAFLDLR
ncbi:MAG: aldo/keto reductase [Chthonomonadaceae bacterium]|nr:aldo/keto reductase [Chthonomonadaceae bacterium]